GSASARSSRRLALHRPARFHYSALGPRPMASPAGRRSVMAKPLAAPHSPPSILPVLVGILIAPALAVAGPEEAAFRAQVAPVLKRYGLDSHGGQKPRGGLPLDAIATDFDKSSAKWKAVLARLGDHSMPPRGKAQPTAREAKSVTDWIASGLRASQARRAATQGPARAPRPNP